MKFLEKIKPHLTSDDFLIQRTVLHALKDYPSVPQEWTITLLKEAFQNLGEKKSILVNIDNFAFNDEALELLIDHLPKMDIMKIHLVLRLLNQIEPALVLKYRNELSNYIPTETWALYELIVNGPEETVRSEYKKAVSDLEKLKYHESAPYNRAKILAACLVRKGWITEAEIAQVMEKDLKDPYFSYEGILSVYMVGLLKLEKYIPTLADLLDRDDDILLVETAASLIQLQSDEVIVAISPYLMKTESVIFASTVAENIKTDLAVQVLREAYHVAETIDDQDIIIEALCHQLSKEALPEIKDHMEKGKFSTIVDMEETAYGFFRIMGEDHPNLEKWKQAAIKREMHYKEVERNGSILQTVQNEKKVGRNDPCPCGSGKKYKKCCGK